MNDTTPNASPAVPTEDAQFEHKVGELDFVGLIEDTIVRHWNKDAFTDYQGETFQYKDVARKIEKLHILFENAGLVEGDKVALCGRNSSHWAVAYLAVLTYGAVAVPILHEFKANQVHDIVNHSDARLLFVGDHVVKDIVPDDMPHLEGIIQIADFQLFVCRSERLNDARERLNALYGMKYPKYFRPQHVHYKRQDGEQLALINYTSGTTSRSKGVLIPFRALWSNYMFACSVYNKVFPEGEGRVVSILPLAHMYGMSFEFIYEFFRGGHIYFLTRIPSPKIIFNAFNIVKPHVIISVPLIIEKVIKKMVWPKLEAPSMKLLLRLPIISQKILDRIREELYTAFGAQFNEIIVGGAAFNSEIEEFLHRIGFPFTVGYGATECAPIICYAPWNEFVPGSCGKVAPRMELRIDSPDPHNVVGEILVRGMNVMLGYYKNEEATRETLDEDGWYHTGDLGVIDTDGNVFIRGRSKNMLLGANGTNIYPEEIEDKLNTLPYVAESIVIQKGEKLYALIHPDFDEAQHDGLDQEAVRLQMEQNRQELNNMVPSYQKIAGIRIYEQEFEKTPKRSIKRFLYLNEDV
ncbi:MAG: AMP-binding protein [Bacteroidaceae bacterium]|nr:AMP-binding protein [Bacteroidaceae bacterium]